jgi:tRNA (guanine37-N1)-methyltransferase
MRFDIVTIFPEFFAGPLDYGIVRRARESGLIDVRVQDLREFTHDRHRTVDDRPFGGGEGMVLKPEPLFEAVESLLGRPQPNASTVTPAASSGATDAAVIADSTSVILLSASGKLFRQCEARRLAGLQRIILLCGRYEGVDERVTQHLATEELSIGDFVLSGGELAAGLVVDAVTRLLPGALGNEDSALHESFSEPEAAEPLGAAQNKFARDDPRAFRGAASLASAPGAGSLRLDFPHYTRPAEFRGWPVPEVLLGGNHEEIRRWRRRMALEKTRRNRPDLLGDSRSVTDSE